MANIGRRGRDLVGDLVGELGGDMVVMKLKGVEMKNVED